MRLRRSIRTCTTCRCRSPPSGVCRLWPPGCGSWASSCSICGARSAPTGARVLAAAALAAMAAMLGAGMFEYNFGDSEFLMLLLLRHHAALRRRPHGCCRRARMTIAPLAPRRARDIVSRLRGHHVLVVGDVMLDRFIVGDVTRISPEAPVPVVHFQSEFVRLGGAANVAHNLATLGARVSLVGVVGRDVAADRLSDQLAASGIGVEGLVVDRDRPTVEKVRIVTERNQQVARVDYENDGDLSSAVQEQVRLRIDALADDAAVLLVSDYLKGTITPGVMAALTGASQASRCSSIPRFRISTDMPAPRSSPPTTTRRSSRPTAGSGTKRTRAKRPPSSRRSRTARACSSPAESTACGCPVRKRTAPFRQSRARYRTSPAPAIPSSPSWRWRSPPARRPSKRPSSPIRRRHRGRQIRTRDDHRRRTARSVHCLQLTGTRRSERSRRSATPRTRDVGGVTLERRTRRDGRRTARSR